MKPRRIDPIWMSIIGVFVAPLSCALNATLNAMIVGKISLPGAPIFFLATAFLALLVCFPLGLISETIVKLWQSGKVKLARWLSAACGLSFLFCLISFLPTSLTPITVEKEFYYFLAGLLIPALWLICFLLFAIFSRPPQC